METKAKRVLKDLDRSGVPDFGIYTGRNLIDSSFEALKGRIKASSEYVLTWVKLYNSPDINCRDETGTDCYLYEI